MAYNYIWLAIHIYVIVLPVLWTIGILPPIEALVPWAMEQTLVHVFGGSSVSSFKRWPSTIV